MATDVDVQYFSHLNGLTLGNNWGDLIRLLDKALVTGIDFTSITAASIDAQGDVHITLYAAHNAMLFQVVELSGFTPSSLNQKYRIKGVPSTTELILKPHAAMTETSITTVGAGKLASLGYDIIFRDTNDVKRVYRAKNPTAQHPFIRVDESLTSPDGTTGVYTSTYAKYAMVGLLESMEHIDDYENPDVLQLPFNPSDPLKNWKITGTGASVVRGWCKWQWATQYDTTVGYAESQIPSAGNRAFTIVGDSDTFYFLRSTASNTASKMLGGCGLFNSAQPTSLVPNWVLLSTTLDVAANSTATYLYNRQACMPLAVSENISRFHVPNFNEVELLSPSTLAAPILPDYSTGVSNIYSANDVAALEIPFVDSGKFLRGTLRHVYYNGKSLGTVRLTTPILSGSSLYLVDNLGGENASGGSILFYLGEIE